MCRIRTKYEIIANEFRNNNTILNNNFTRLSISARSYRINCGSRELSARRAIYTASSLLEADLATQHTNHATHR